MPQEQMPDKVTLPMTGNMGRSDNMEQMPERIWVSQMEAETLTRPWPDKAPIVHEYIPASRLSALAEENKRLCGLLYGARCVYCGEVVGKDTFNQDLADTVLREHVMVCPNHPVRLISEQNSALAERAQIHANMVSTLAERVERATELLKDAQVVVIGMAALLQGMPLEAKTVALAERISSFLHDGTKGKP